MAEEPRVLFIGAHPDDCELHAGGLAALCVDQGHTVKFVSLTNGDTGHFRMGGGELARRRCAEAQASAAVLGIEYEVLDNHTGELEPDVRNRKDVIRIIRRFEPDLVLTLSADDYHPDHRYASALVQDSAYIVTVPGMCPLTPHLTYNPVYAYCNGSVTASQIFSPTLMFDIDQVIDRKLAMACCHESQFLEWIPYSQGRLDEVPVGKDEQRAWMEANFRKRLARFADKWRERLVRQYGEERGRRIQFAEGLQVCPFGAALDEEKLRRLFPFLPESVSL